MGQLLMLQIHLAALQEPRVRLFSYVDASKNSPADRYIAEPSKDGGPNGKESEFRNEATGLL
jgi:hypothetical protein